MGNVRGPYDAAEWLTMKMLKFDSLPHLHRKNKEHNGRYDYRVRFEQKMLSDYYSREAA